MRKVSTPEEIEYMLQVSATVNKTTVQRMLSSDRSRFNHEARCMVAYFLRFDYNLSLTDIGDILNRGHATVINMIKVHEDCYENFNYYEHSFDEFLYEMGINTNNSRLEQDALKKGQAKIHELHEELARLKTANADLKFKLQKIEKQSKLLISNLGGLCN
tara:strand:- start:2578 stop:3057 length:480 start_codon:yes stop_codon:yes gene_type:complete